MNVTILETTIPPAPRAAAPLYSEKLHPGYAEKNAPHPYVATSIIDEYHGSRYAPWHAQ